jgi:PPOX class probable F420-dependent enzyme
MHVNVDRPRMPGYGVLPATEGTGLLSWSWAEARLADSHDYWLATTRPGGRPHVMPVWGLWLDGALWFSCSRSSTKARNLRHNPVCTLTTDNAREPVVLEGTGELVTSEPDLRRFLKDANAKYATAYTMELMDQRVNACFRVRPSVVFAIDTADFTGSPTRWQFDAASA